MTADSLYKVSHDQQSIKTLRVLLRTVDLSAQVLKQRWHYSSCYSYYSLIRTSIGATIVLLEIKGGSEQRCSSRVSGSLL